MKIKGIQRADTRQYSKRHIHTTGEITTEYCGSALCHSKGRYSFNEFLNAWDLITVIINFNIIFALVIYCCLRLIKELIKQKWNKKE